MYDFAIIGAGMAGASLAAELARDARVLVLEGEDHPGYHSTGRSAAFWEECYGGPELVPLTLASGGWLRDHGFLTPRGALYIGRDGDAGALDGFMDRFAATGATLERLAAPQLAARLPGLHAGWSGAIWEPGCADIDVAGVHAHYLKAGRERGVTLHCRARLAEAQRQDGTWLLTTGAGDHETARMLVNAAGAWADPVAEIAGARPLGIQPLRRTVVQLRTDPAPAPDLPLVLDIGGGFYFKPENGRLWLSPHDETPTPPCDAAPEDIDIATAIDRLAQVMDWQVQAVEHKWAGLRSFAPDRLPLYGPDPRVEGFAWFAGQGGFGIQTAPAAARLAAQILLGNGPDALTQGIDPTVYSPGRFGA